MAGGETPGPAGGPWCETSVDDGTLCRNESCVPGSVGGMEQALQSLTITGPVLVGLAKRNPGYNFDGTPAEDMQYADSPVRAAAIKKDPVFALNDATLAAYMKQLMTSLSIGKMETVALEMHERFVKGVGGVYRSDTLNAEIYNHSAFATYHYAFLEQLKTAIRNAKFDPSQISLISMGLLSFSSFWDKASGLGITVHQVWSVKAELENYRLDRDTGFWSCQLVYTLYDHFGLDWDDILKHGEDRIPQYHTGDFFKAWYILQHYRTAKPFITEMKRTVFIAGKIE